MAHPAPAQPDPQRFRTLPAPVSRDQLRTSEASRPVPEEKDDRLREMEWMLRGASG
jgi:hypothetical protein